MPTSGSDRRRKEALYPDELPGRALTVDPDRLNGELEYWDAGDDDDAEELPDDAQYGWWLPVVDTDGDAAVWAAAPEALDEALDDLGVEPGDSFEVLDIEKGPEQHDPYRVDARRVDPGDPA